jgi:hypothetical protein
VNAGVQIKAIETSNNDNNTHSLNLLIMKGNERERERGGKRRVLVTAKGKLQTKCFL